MNKKTVFIILFLLLIIGAAFWSFTIRHSPPADIPNDETIAEITVYRGEQCDCCTKWNDHLKTAGFSVRDEVVGNIIDIKIQNRVPQELGSCHTAKIDGYVVEGHVPADEIKRMIDEQPEGVGIAVPGMPAGSPGMESFRSESYNVVLFDESGNESVYAEY